MLHADGWLNIHRYCIRVRRGRAPEIAAPLMGGCDDQNPPAGEQPVGALAERAGEMGQAGAGSRRERTAACVCTHSRIEVERLTASNSAMAQRLPIESVPVASD